MIAGLISNKTQSILIVDDHRMILDLLSQRFKKIDFQVFKADNGIDAWNIFKREQINFVLTDIRMPGIDGIELCHRIRNQSPETIIAVMTGGSSNVAEELLKNGTVNYFFPKPLKVIEVCKSFLAEVQTA